MVRDQSRNRRKHGSAGTLAGAVAFTTLALGVSDLRGQYLPPAGYTKTELTPMAGNTPVVADDIGVSSDGQLAVFTAATSTLRLYNNWQNLQTPIATITDAKDWTSITDMTFIGENKVVFGENTTDTAWSVDFGNTASPSNQFPGTFPHIEGVAKVNSTTVLISGSMADFPNTGGLYLETLNVSSGVSSPLVPNSSSANVGTGFEGGPGVTKGGNAVLLDTGDATGIARVYNFNTGDSIQNISLTGSGAYGMTFDPVGNAFITTGNTLTEIPDIDSGTPAQQFGSFSDFDFPTGIGFTGGSFLPFDSTQTGALIVNGEFTGDGGLFAITSVPEPTSTGLIMLAALGITKRRRSASTAEVVHD